MLVGADHCGRFEMRRILAIALTFLTTAPALAQEIYGGLGLDFATPHGEDGQVLVFGFGGARFGAGPVTYGAEVDYALGLDSAADHNALRLRGIVRNDMGDFAIFGSLGLVSYGLDGGGNEDGATYGLGAEYGVGETTALRVEVIRDHVDNYNSAGVTTLRMGLAFGF